MSIPVPNRSAGQSASLISLASVANSIDSMVSSTKSRAASDTDRLFLLDPAHMVCFETRPRTDAEAPASSASHSTPLRNRNAQRVSQGPRVAQASVQSAAACQG